MGVWGFVGFRVSGFSFLRMGLLLRLRHDVDHVEKPLTRLA